MSRSAAWTRGPERRTPPVPVEGPGVRVSGLLGALSAARLVLPVVLLRPVGERDEPGELLG